MKSNGDLPLILLLVALFYLCGALWTAVYAERKGFPAIPVFIAGVLISFPIVLLAVAVMPPRTPENWGR